MAALGIQITRKSSATQQGLVDILHAEIGKGHGCIITMPSQWNSAVENAGSSWNPRTYSGPTHVGLACGYGQDGAQGMIRVMNPWGGFWHDGDDSYWAARLLEGEVWVATMMIPQGWKDDGRTLTAPNGVPVVRGFRDFVLNYAGGWESDNLPLAPERLVDQLEWGNLTHGPGSRQDFRYRTLACPHHSDGSWGPTYRVWVGQDVLALAHQLDAANKHIADLEQQLANQPVPVPVTTPPDPKATEALAALVELAKALTLVQAA